MCRGEKKGEEPWEWSIGNGGKGAWEYKGSKIYMEGESGRRGELGSGLDVREEGGCEELGR